MKVIYKTVRSRKR